jgi:TetR/AcrR family transcriptional regulator
VFGLINKISAEQENGLKQTHAIAAMLLSFAEKNPGMTRVLIGDALVNEDQRLQLRINQLHDRLEAALKQSLRLAATQGEIDKDSDVAAQANLMLAFIIGRWHQYAKSGFKRLPTELWQKQGPLLLG